MSADGPIFEKYRVSRTDGTDGEGQRHYGDEYFVLDLSCDEHAIAALRAYAMACERTHPQLAWDIRRKYMPEESFT